MRIARMIAVRLRSGWIWRVVNLAIVATSAWLVWPLTTHESIAPVVLSRYSVGYALYLLTWFSFLAVYAACAVFGSATINAACFGVVLVVFLLGEGAARIKGLGGYASTVDATRWPRPYVEFAGQPGATFNG